MLKNKFRYMPFTLPLITVLGLSFWFFVGFPWANHNESYAWVQQIEQLSLSDMLTKIMYPQPAFRPLTQVAAYFAYTIFGPTAYADQIFNYIVAIISWVFLMNILDEKRLFSVIALGVGGFLFSGYIYLFHLHGVCYSPLLLYIAILFYYHIEPPTTKNMVALFLITFVIALFHTFAFALYVAFIIGYSIENRKYIDRNRGIILLLFITSSVILSKIFLSSRTISVIQFSTIIEMITSYKMLELNGYISMFCLSLSILTVNSINFPLNWNRIIIGVVALVAALCYHYSIPVIIIWILICIIKTISNRQWGFGFLLFACALIPLTQHGSPTHSIFVVMICSAITVIGSPVDGKLKILHSGILMVPIGIIMFIPFLLKNNYHIPVLSKLSNPVLAEKEKTFQLENIMNWMLHSEFGDYYVMFTSPATIPRFATDAVHRKHRPPTQEEYINEFMSYKRHGNVLGEKLIAEDPRKQLILTFGDERIKDAVRVYEVDGNFAGSAFVYLQTQ
jgi:hypothetical protein